MLPDVVSYNIATNTRTARAPYPQPVVDCAIMVSGGAIYTAGGRTTSGPIAKTYRYDPSSNRWDDQAVPDLPEPRTAAAGGLLNGRWILAGGMGAHGLLDSAIAWDPATHGWGHLPPLPRVRRDSAGVTAGQVFYAVGGLLANQRVTGEAQQSADFCCR